MAAAASPVGPWGSRRLRVSALSGQNLAAKDINGLSDPYLVIWIGESGQLTQPDEGKAEIFKTKYIAKTLNPNWGETREFSSRYCHSLRKPVLHVVCWDKDTMTADDYMGQCEIPLDGRDQVCSVELKALGSNAGEKVSGTVTIGLQPIPDPKPPSGPFNVLVHIVKGTSTTKTIEVSGLRPYSTVKDLKDAIHAQTAIPQDSQVFYKHASHPEVEIAGTLGVSAEDNLKRLFEHGIVAGVHINMKQYG